MLLLRLYSTVAVFDGPPERDLGLRIALGTELVGLCFPHLLPRINNQSALVLFPALALFPTHQLLDKWEDR